MKPYVKLMPEFGHPSSIWTNITNRPPGQGGPPWVELDEFPVSAELAEGLTIWTREFHGHCSGEFRADLGRATWRDDGFDVDQWNLRGIELARSISAEIPEAEVVYSGGRYLDRSEPSRVKRITFKGGVEVFAD